MCTKERLKDRIRKEAVVVQRQDEDSWSLFVCDNYDRSFRRKQNIDRHKCHRNWESDEAATIDRHETSSYNYYCNYSINVCHMPQIISKMAKYHHAYVSDHLL